MVGTEGEILEDFDHVLDIVPIMSEQYINMLKSSETGDNQLVVFYLTS